MKDVVKCFPIDIVDSEELWVSESDYDALMVDRDELLRVVEWMVNYTAAEHDGVALVDNDRLFDAGLAIIAKCRGDV